MLTPGEVQAIDAALANARAEAARLDAVARESDGPLAFLFPSEARRAADTAAALIRSIEGITTRLALAPNYDHETAAHAVQLARELAEPGWTARALENSTLGEALADLEIPIPSLGWVKVAILAVALAAGAFLVVQAKHIAREVRA